MGSFSVRFIVSVVRYAHNTPSRREMALRGIRGRVVSWSELLPLMVRSGSLSNLKLTFRLVGINVQSLVSVRRFSSRPPRCQVHSAVCLQ